MDWKKNDVFQTTIEDMSDSGEGIGKTDGFTWFIKDAVIGDRVEAKAMKVKKSYGFARLMPVARQCGGCQIQAMDYQEQLRFKENKVCSNLRRIGGLENLVFRNEDGSLRTEENEFTNVPWKPEDGKSEDGKSGEISVYPIMGMEEPDYYRILCRKNTFDYRDRGLPSGSKGKQRNSPVYPRTYGAVSY